MKGEGRQVAIGGRIWSALMRSAEKGDAHLARQPLKRRQLVVGHRPYAHVSLGAHDGGRSLAHHCMPPCTIGL